MGASGGHVGILGGTFDPPHNGHVLVAACVRHALSLTQVMVIPANIPWQKQGLRQVTDPIDRLDMTRAAFASLEGVAVSTIELDRGGDSYSIDTIEALHGRFPGVRFRLVVGSDVAAQLETWHRPDAIREMADLVVFDRPAAQGARPPTGWPYELVEVPALEVSSTEIRVRVRAGEPIDGMVPPEVATIIATRGLYRAGRV